MKKRLAIGCATLAVAGAAAIGVLVVAAWRDFSENFASPQRSVFAVPAFPDKALLLYEVGFTDRSFLLFVRDHKEQDPQFVLEMWGPQGDLFDEFQWTADGQVAVFSLYVSGHSYRVFAYDFSTDTSYLPPEGTVLPTLPPLSTFVAPEETRKIWAARESSVLELAESHGGLSGEVFNRDAVRAAAQRIKNSEVPEYTGVSAPGGKQGKA